MTGLDPDRHVIVEIATLVTNDELEIVAEGHECRDRRERQSTEESVAGEAVSPVRVGNCGRDDQHPRKHTASHDR